MQLFKTLLFVSFFFYTIPLYANVVWPAMFVSNSLSLFLIVVSTIIEAVCFYWFLKNISYTRAFVMSCIGNAASALLGAFIMTLAMLLWHFAFDRLLGGTFSIYNRIATFVFMYLGSSLIEFFVIKKLFRYPSKQLWPPILIGNFITYVWAGLKSLGYVTW